MKKLLTGGFGKKVWINVYNNADGGNDSGNDGGNNGGGSGGGNNTGGNDADDDKPTISQKKLSAILAEEKRKFQKVTQDQIAQLEQLKKSEGVSRKAQAELESRIEELQNSLLTKEELSKKERDKLERDYKKQVEGLSGERDTWRHRYTDAIIERGIQDAAISEKAFSSNQIVRLLKSDTRLVEDLDSEGKPTGTYTPKVKFHDVDKENKPVVLDLTIPEAVKRMKELPEYGNLFESTLAGGLGGSSGHGGGNKSTGFDPNMSHEQYKEWRRKQGLGRKP